jgi:hypothetical protein
MVIAAFHHLRGGGFMITAAVNAQVGVHSGAVEFSAFRRQSLSFGNT